MIIAIMGILLIIYGFINFLKKDGWIFYIIGVIIVCIPILVNSPDLTRAGEFEYFDYTPSYIQIIGENYYIYTIYGNGITVDKVSFENVYLDINSSYRNIKVDKRKERLAGIIWDFPFNINKYYIKCNMQDVQEWFYH